MILLRHAFKSLSQQRFRSLLSILGIVFGVAALVAMLAVGEGAKRQTLKEINRLGVQNTLLRSESGALSIRTLEAVSSALGDAALYSGALKIESTDVPHLMGVSPSYGVLFHLSLYKGRWLSPLDEVSRAQVVVIGKDLAQTLGPKGALGRSLTLGSEKFVIIGVLDEETEGALIHQDLRQAAFIPLSAAGGLKPYGQEAGALTEIVVQAKNEGDAAAVAEVARAVLKRTAPKSDAAVVVAEELRRQRSKTQLTFNIVLASVAAVTLLVGGIGIVNVMLASVVERTREIGVRRAVGATQKLIARQFLLEALVLGSAGAIGGVAVGLLLAFSIRFATHVPLFVTWWSVALAVLLALGVSALAGLYPAVRAAKLNPVEALRVN
ncbi:MAG: ABC transporter permease [Chlamydiia bacterium]|nr:ABC transporter permease [Chlamydiia bacterium]